MEEWQVKHIDVNLVSLVKLIRCTTTVKTWLTSRQVLTDEEVENLTKLGHYHGHFAEARELLGILKTRNGGYEALLEALEKTRQTGSLDIVKKGQFSVQDDDVRKFANLNVNIVGNVTKLRTVFSDIRKEDICVILKDIEARKEFYRIVNSEEAVLQLYGELPNQPPMYIPRSVSNRLMIDPTVFKKTCDDDQGFSSVLSVLVQLLKRFLSLEEIQNLLLFQTEPQYTHLLNACLRWLLVRIAASGSPEMAQEIFCLFENGPDNFLLNFCRLFPDDCFSPLEAAIARNDFDMTIYFADKINLRWQRLFISCFIAGNMTVEEIKGRVFIIMHALRIGDRVLEVFRNGNIPKYFEGMESYYTKINILTCLASQKNFSLNSARQENKVVLLERGLRANDEDFINLLLLMFGNCDGQAKAVAVKLLTQNRDGSAETILLAMDKEDAKETFLKQRALYLEKRRFLLLHLILTNEFLLNLHQVETLKLLVALWPDFSQCNNYRRNYLHYACKQAKVDWIPFLIVSGYDVNQQDFGGDTPFS